MFGRKKKKASGQLWDPRLGHDYRTQLEDRHRTVFSSLDQNCIVISIRHEIMRANGWLEPIIFEILRRSGSSLFGNVYPARRSHLKYQHTLGGSQIGESWFANLAATEANVRQFIMWMANYATFEEWLLGSASSSLDPTDAYLRIERTPSPQVDYFLAHFHQVDGICCFNHDAHEAMLFFRPFEECDKIIDRIQIICQDSH